MAKTGDEVLSAFQQTVVEEEVEVRDEDKLRVGIIGTGWIAEAHIESFKRMKDVKVVAMADLIPGKAEKFAKRYGIENCNFYPDHKSMLDNDREKYEEFYAAFGRQLKYGTVSDYGAHKDACQDLLLFYSHKQGKLVSL